MRTCRSCGEAKPLDQFDLRADTGNRRSVCKDCRRMRQRRPSAAFSFAADPNAGLKACTRCGEVKPLAEFPPLRRGGDKRQSWCRSCFAVVNAAYYAKNREREKSRATSQTTGRRAMTREKIVEYLLAHPCVDCGERDIVVLEFDHRGEKIGDVSTYANGRTWATVLKEIEKCDVRCANCHRRATASRVSSKRQRPARAQTRPVIQLDLEIASLRRTCRLCGTDKPLSEFPLRSARTGVRQHICLACQREASARRYATAVGRPVRTQRSRGTALHAVLVARVFEYLIEHPCATCGETDPIVLDFDHREAKIANVADLVRDGALWESIAAEMAKCDVRCANCHRRRTVEGLRGYRIRALERPGRDSNPRPLAS